MQLPSVVILGKERATSSWTLDNSKKKLEFVSAGYCEFNDVPKGCNSLGTQQNKPNNKKLPDKCVVNETKPVNGNDEHSNNEVVPSLRKRAQRKDDEEIVAEKRLLEPVPKRPRSNDVQELRLQYSWTGLDLARRTNHPSGFSNMRNDCFMNSVLQFVFHTPQLLRYIVARKNNHKCASEQIRCIYCVLHCYYDRMCKRIATMEAKSLRNIINTSFPNRIINNQEDAHEMLIFLLSRLEPPLPKRNGLSSSTPRPFPVTEIDRIFGGKLSNSIKCRKCGYAQTNSEQVRELNLNLNVMLNVMQPCLEHYIMAYFKIEELDDYKCDKCRQACSFRQLSIEKAPNVLVVQLKRFRHNGTKNSTEIDIPIDLDLTRFTSNEKGEKNSTLFYKLYGFISHSGLSVNSGHYKATMRSYDGKWYIFDDDYVNLTEPKRFDPRQAYLLFYYKTTLTSTAAAPKNLASNAFSAAKPVMTPIVLRKSETTLAEASTVPSPHNKVHWATSNKLLNGHYNGDSQSVPLQKRPLSDHNSSHTNDNHYSSGSDSSYKRSASTWQLPSSATQNYRPPFTCSTNSTANGQNQNNMDNKSCVLSDLQKSHSQRG